ncbi:MAG: protein kinase [Planctomycetota bacterium]
MPICPGCRQPSPAASRFCAHCGTEQRDPDATTPVDTAPVGPSGAAGSSRWSPPPSSDGARFVPGSIVAERYRVIGLLGRGGMGEVYRADDLRLGQPVALKFLSPEANRDPARHRAFLDEVRMAVRVTHPNVCRIHDVGDADGHPFLSMEYVDGEDLASLLRRIGRLPQDKAIEIARQLCSGLAAAHDQRILHRDLKPANVMLDGRGQVKVMDFGLAGLEQTLDGSAIAGTPAYMAPEQLAGGELTVRTDVFALGLVLYELFTGKRVFAGRTLAEIRREHLDSQPSSPSTHVADLDPAVERVLLQCLEREPGDRPASVRAVAAALPGGDPLAAALAAGETPSPELVAATGRAGTMAPWVAAVCAVLAVAGVITAVLLSERIQVSRLTPLPKPPAALVEIARQRLAALGYANRDGFDSAYGFAVRGTYLAWLAKRGAHDPDWWRALRAERPSAIQFYYRESPTPLLALGLWRMVSTHNPPNTTPGMRLVALDPAGRLDYLEVVPAFDAAPETAVPSAPATLFDAADLPMSEFAPTPPHFVPPGFADERLAWEGPCPGVDGERLQVRAAFHQGQPVYLRLVPPWSQEPSRAPLNQPNAALQTAILVVGAIGAGLLAIRNLRAGRGHRRGALRLAFFVLCLFLPASFTVAASDFLGHLGSATLHAFLVWLFYIGLEPAVRRIWPTILVSWIRLLDGRWRDPLVGNHLVVGTVYGCLSVLTLQGARLWPQVQPDASWIQLVALHSPASAFEKLVAGVNSAILPTLLGVVLLVLLQMLLRRRWLTVSLVFLLGVLVQLGSSPMQILWIVLMLGLFFAVFLRFGLLATVVGQTIQGLFFLIPLTFDANAWYFDRSLMVFSFIAVILTWGLWVALDPRALSSGRGPLR